MAAGLELEAVQKGRGKVHLAPAPVAGEPVRTLCGQELAGGAWRAVDAGADCSICLRRRRDPAAVAQAFFAADPDRVLELSVEQARARRGEQPAPRPRVVAARPAPPTPVKAPAPERPRRIGELATGGLREFAENVYVAPGGTIVRIDGGRVAEVLGEGRFQVLRRGDRLEVRAGGVVVRGRVEEVEAAVDDSS